MRAGEGRGSEAWARMGRAIPLGPQRVCRPTQIEASRNICFVETDMSVAFRSHVTQNLAYLIFFSGSAYPDSYICQTTC